MRLKVRSAAVSLLVALPGLSHALGLGDIQLKSPLNSPLNAEIELIGATAEELAGLRVQMASRDLFARYGLDYPAFIAGIQMRTGRSADGRDVIMLSSSAPMTEPFATLLVEANVARQRIVREYTVLFDPPVFAPAAAGSGAPPPVAAPATGAGERSATIDRPAPQAAASGGEGSYTVQRGDSLSLVARRVSDGSDQAMMAIYRANPSAFEGNINLLRSGAVLRVPDAGAIAAVDPGEARREVRRQSVSWNSARGESASGSADPRLRLVPPGGTATQGGGAEGAEVAALRDRVSRLEGELAESRRLLELRNAELARLQSGTAAPAAPASPEEIEAPPATPEAEAPQTAAPAEPPAAEAAAEAPPPPQQPAAAPASAPEAGPTLIDRLKALWYIPVGLLVLLLGWLGLRSARRKREQELDAGLGAFGAGAGPEFRESSSNTLPLRKPVADADEAGFLVEESGTHQRINLAERSASRRVDIDEAAATDSLPKLDATAALEQGDPLAEADFHMAYGLYDQAADLVRLAIEREPQRRDLKLKLLEVFFVWGNKDQFLQTAHELAETRDQAEPGEWEKVVIMGKQLAPEEPLFSQSAAGVGHGGIDLNLEGGQNLVDFDLHGEPEVSITTDGGVDLDLSSVLGDRDPTGNSVALDFSLDDPNRGNDSAVTATTRQMVQPGFGDAAQTVRVGMDTEGPTVEQPQLEPGQTMRQKLDAQLHLGSVDQTAELAIDDLGLDLGKLDATGTNLLDDSRLTRALDAPDGPDAPTLIAGLGDTSRNFMDDAGDVGNQLTELLPLGDVTGRGGNPLSQPSSTQVTQILQFDQVSEDAGATSRLAALDFDLGAESAFDGDEVTGTRPVLVATDVGLDLDVGAPEQGEGGEYVQTQRIGPEEIATPGGAAPVADLEPITMSEVGTKLDLARAYMDMGDPDGARSILNEVLQEGSPGQRQEAQRLIDSIPG
ncbi:MAG: FimV/HubP family polar landmark protein [Steroidobacteraceae bacterium]